jgi:hypothetical protein
LRHNRLARIFGRALLFLTVLATLASCPSSPDQAGFTFVVAADMRNFASGSAYFAGACDALLQSGPGSFMISPGDIDPPDDILAVVKDHIYSSYPWVPVVGNHEIDTPYSSPHMFVSSIEWLRSYAIPFATSPGPAGAATTCFSFDFGTAHFVVLNEYYNGTADDFLVNGHGYVSGELRAWLDADLAATSQPITFVIGHEPAFPQPDAEPPYRLRHLGESLDADPALRDAFWSTLKTHGVKAYFCGHTHNYSVVKIDDVWQIDAGHARGLGDTGARSTFVKITVSPRSEVTYVTWRLRADATGYEIADTGSL